MFDQAEQLIDEYARLEAQLADPGIHADQGAARRLGRRYAELGPIVGAYRMWRQTCDDEAAARELATEDSAFRAEATQLHTRRLELEDELRLLLLPRDPSDSKDVILEVKAG